MKSIRLFYVIQIAFILSVLNGNVSGQTQGREIKNFNFSWKFHKGDISDGQKPGFDDSGWRVLDLPHDWSIEGPFSKEYASCTGYLPGGIGWYRKTFYVPEDKIGSKTIISFEGVYDNSEVWINGTYLGKRPNGYISFQYDLTPFLIYGGNNLISVRVDHSQFADSRWYTGSGIYRNVALILTSPVHIKEWGVYASSKDVSEEKTRLSIETTIRNETGLDTEVSVSNYLLSGNDTVARVSGRTKVMASSTDSITQAMEIINPILWNTDNPCLYSLVTVINGRDFFDNKLTRLGFRSIRFDPDKGFFLNGKNLKLKGVCMHHAAGALGAAVPQKVIERRLKILKEMGCNAIRTSHNPYSPEFLDLCDQLGFLVIDEAFDEWELPKKKWISGWNNGIPGKEGYSEYFKEWHKKDLTDMVLRDRNHPSIIMWSIGNEIDYPNDPYTHPVLNTEANPQTWAKYDPKLPGANRLGEIAKELKSIIKEYDNERPVTAGLASALMSNETGYAEALDVVGYNYQEFRYSTDHEKFPKRILYGSENGMSVGAWNSVEDNDYVLGQFLWTGIDYLGEAGQFPNRNSTSGLIDLAGNKKPEYYFRQSLWSDKPMVYIGTTDHLKDNSPVNLWAHKRVEPVWNWKTGQPVLVSVFTNCDEVTLFLNDRSLGSRKMSGVGSRTLTWELPFERGVLRAVASTGGREMADCELRSSGPPFMLEAVSDTNEIKANREDIAQIFLTLCDKDGNVVYTGDNEITCHISGPVRLLGMEDSNPDNIEDYKDNNQHAYHGKLLIYIQALDKTGRAEILFSSPGLEPASIVLDVVK